ncbi:MAG: UDP-N-acetylglucosamine 2-epimerase (hydrolyzing) [Rhodospirillaceae bacterium]|nr:UDP-N-acetylglucosamine 2-epimerase (hydrolyzing) [Rhodospirillales bacterium]
MPRRIAVVTGTRAEYGLLKGLIRRLHTDQTIDLALVVTAAHLDPAFGETWREIEADGLPITAKVPMVLDGGSRLAAARGLGAGTAAMAEALENLRPDLVVVLGDRMELLAVASACVILGLPLAHIHGGEITEGAMDDAIRHALTKMSHLHFAAAEPYRRRILQMGEAPERVVMAGALGIDNVMNTDFLDRAALEADLGFALDRPVLLVTYHPETMDDRPPAEAFSALLTALERFPETRVVITKANADPGGQIINDMIDAWTAQRPDHARAFTSLGVRRYLSLMRHSAAVVGNSSSGIIETPAFGIPTVNIGGRQQGRLRADSIIDCGPGTEAITTAIAQALSEPFRHRAAATMPPYGRGGAAEAIHRVLASVEIAGLRHKHFVDLDMGELP